VDETEFLLRVAGQRRESARRYEAEIRAEYLEAVEKLDGFGVSHAGLQNEFNGYFFGQPSLGFISLSVSPWHIFFNALQHGRQFHPRGARNKTGCDGKFQSV